MNRVELIGRITKDIELKSTPTGKNVVSFSLAVSRTKNETDFINCVAWNNTADLLANYTKKGSQIGLEGSISTRNYQNNKGETVYVTEVLVSHVDLLGYSNNNSSPQPIQEETNDITSDALPF